MNYDVLDFENITAYKNLKELIELKYASFSAFPIEIDTKGLLRKIDKRFDNVKISELEKFSSELETLFLRGLSYKTVSLPFVYSYFSKGDEFPYQFPFTEEQYMLPSDGEYIYDLNEENKFKMIKGEIKNKQKIGNIDLSKLNKIVLFNLNNTMKSRIRINISKKENKNKLLSYQDITKLMYEEIEKIIASNIETSISSDMDEFLFYGDANDMRYSYEDFIFEFADYDFFSKILEENNGVYITDSIQQKENEFIQYFSQS